MRKIKMKKQIPFLKFKNLIIAHPKKIFSNQLKKRCVYKNSDDFLLLQIVRSLLKRTNRPPANKLKGRVSI